jgi:hypothetical protein
MHAAARDLAVTLRGRSPRRRGRREVGVDDGGRAGRTGAHVGRACLELLEGFGVAERDRRGHVGAVVDLGQIQDGIDEIRAGAGREVAGFGVRGVVGLRCGADVRRGNDAVFLGDLDGAVRIVLVHGVC